MNTKQVTSHQGFGSFTMVSSSCNCKN